MSLPSKVEGFAKIFVCNWGTCFGANKFVWTEGTGFENRPVYGFSSFGGDLKRLLTGF